MQLLREWKPKSFKVVWGGIPARLDELLLLNPDFIVIRDHPLSEQKDVSSVAEARQKGREHALQHRKVANTLQAAFGWSPKRTLYEGWNEPKLWSKNPPVIMDAYESARCGDMDDFGLFAATGNINTGWPGDSGPDTPVNWTVFPLLKKVLEANHGHKLALHEYFYRWGPEAMRPTMQDPNARVGGWLWDMGRYRQCPWDCKIIITECGMDDAVATGHHLGWHSLADNLEEAACIYTDFMLWYAEKLAETPQVEAAYIYTHDSQSAHWLSFDTRQNDFRVVFCPANNAADFPEPPPIPPTPVPDLEIDDITYDLTRHPVKRYETRRHATIGDIILHHAGPPSTVETVAEVAAVHHVEEKDYPGIGYHYWISMEDGEVKIYQTNKLGVVATHAGNWEVNKASVGICLAGDFRGDSFPTDRQQAALAWLINELETVILKRTLAVGAHSHVSGVHTVCPGTNGWYDTFLKDDAPVGGLTPIRWNAEEATREIEDSITDLEATMNRMLTEVVAPLRELEGV